MKRPRRQFTREFKAEIVRLILDGGRSVPAVSRDHDLGETSVFHWVKQARVCWKKKSVVVQVPLALDYAPAEQMDRPRLADFRLATQETAHWLSVTAGKAVKAANKTLAQNA